MTAITPCATLLAQLTDPHIRAPGERAYGLVDTAAHLREAVATVLRLPQRPDAVVLTGDLTDFGQPAEYDHQTESDERHFFYFAIADPAIDQHHGGSNDQRIGCRKNVIQLIKSEKDHQR